MANKGVTIFRELAEQDEDQALLIADVSDTLMDVYTAMNEPLPHDFEALVAYWCKMVRINQENGHLWFHISEHIREKSKQKIEKQRCLENFLGNHVTFFRRATIDEEAEKAAKAEKPKEEPREARYIPPPPSGPPPTRPPTRLFNLPGIEETGVRLPELQDQQAPEEVTREVLRQNWNLHVLDPVPTTEFRHWASSRLFWLLVEIGRHLMDERDNRGYVSQRLPSLLDELTRDYNMRLPFMLHYEAEELITELGKKYNLIWRDRQHERESP